MKKNRQEAIIELIQQYPIETQEELLSRIKSDWTLRQRRQRFQGRYQRTGIDQETGCRWEADLLSDRSGR